MSKKIGVLLWVIFISACSTVKPKAPVGLADGYAADCKQALSLAKIKAAENYTGTFLNVQRTLINDKNYTESVDEYSGGVIRSYKVVSSSGGSPCYVTIEAQMSSDTSQVLVNPQTKLDLGGVERQLNHQKVTLEVLNKLIHRPEMIGVEYRSVSPVTYQDRQVTVRVAYTKIVPSPKWLSDLEAFLAVHGTKTTYHQKDELLDMSRKLVNLVALPIILPAIILSAPFKTGSFKPSAESNPADSFSVCFDKGETKNCYQGWAAIQIYNQINSASIVAVISHANQMVTEFRVFDRYLPVSLNQELTPALTWVDDEYRPKKSFNLLASKPIAGEGVFNLKSEWVVEGYDLSFRLKFNQ